MMRLRTISPSTFRKGRKGSSWSEEQLETLRLNYPTIDNPRDLVPLIGKSYGAIKGKASVLGLIREKHAVGLSTATQAELDYIQANYLTMPPQRIADALGRGETFVKGRMKALGLEVPREIIEQRVAAARIQPGNTPKNKGKKQSDYMSAETIARTAGTRFQKGQIPHNAQGVKDGDIRVRRVNGGQPQKFIRLSLGKWQELQRYNWEQVHGPIPKGMVLRSRNGDTMDCRVENWELITKAENARRNAGHEKLPDRRIAAYLVGKNGNPELKEALLQQPELLDLKRQQIILKRKINEHSGKD